jgi:hypothetical protein
MYFVIAPLRFGVLNHKRGQPTIGEGLKGKRG